MITRQIALKNALRAATENMHATGEVVPMVIGHAGDKLLAYNVGSLMATPETKDAAAGMLRKALREAGATLYVLMMEAWFANVTNKDDPFGGPPPSERPDRIECLVLHASDAQGDTMETYRTVRNKRGRFQSFKLLDSTETNANLAVEGRFIGLLREKVIH